MLIKDIFQAVTQKDYKVTIGNRVVAFLGAKGGAGTTTFALDTAALLAKRGKQVLFIDGNLDLPTAYRFLLKDPSKFESRLDEALLRSDISIDSLFVETKYKNIRLISGNIYAKLGDYLNLRKDSAEKLIELSERRFDVVIIDCDSNPYLEVTVAAIEHANNVFLVTDADKQNLIMLAKLKDYFSVMLGVDKLRNVIQNKVTLRAIPEPDLREVDLTGFAVVPFVQELVSANIADALLIDTKQYEKAGWGYAKVIERIADTINN